MKILLIITGGILLFKVCYDRIYYKGYRAGLKTMRDRAEDYMRKRRAEELEQREDN